jgi:pimeloyl-ACP methyl ester carboxylesterase
MARTTVDFDSGGRRCAAWLYLPDGGGRPAPVVVMGHGLGAVKAMRLDAYAERFCAAGYACLIFDYRHFGGSGGTPRQLVKVRRQLQDWASALAYARSLTQVDGKRAVVWGSSFGGGHVLAVAAADHRVAAAMAQCAFTDGVGSALVIKPLTTLKVLARAVRDLLASATGRAPVHVTTAGPAGSTALMNAPDAKRGYLALVDEGSDTGGFSNEAAARAALDIIRYAPGRRAKDIQCPLWAGICDRDNLVPPGKAARQISRAPHAEIRRYPCGHFDIYLGAGFEQTVADPAGVPAQPRPGLSDRGTDGETQHRPRRCRSIALP